MAAFIEDLPAGTIVLGAAPRRCQPLPDRPRRSGAGQPGQRSRSAHHPRLRPRADRRQGRGAARHGRRGQRRGRRVPASGRRPAHTGRRGGLDSPGARAVTDSDAPASSRGRLLAGWDVGVAVAAGLLAGIVYWLRARRQACCRATAASSSSRPGWPACHTPPATRCTCCWAGRGRTSWPRWAGVARGGDEPAVGRAGRAGRRAGDAVFSRTDRNTDREQSAGRWLLTRGCSCRSAALRVHADLLEPGADRRGLHAARGADGGDPLAGAAVAQGSARLVARSCCSPLLWALALVAGLSLAHHRTTVLSLPVLVVFLWAVAGGRYWRNHWRAAAGRRRAAAPAAAALPLRAAARPATARG